MMWTGALLGDHSTGSRLAERGLKMFQSRSCFVWCHWHLQVYSGVETYRPVERKRRDCITDDVPLHAPGFPCTSLRRKYVPTSLSDGNREVWWGIWETRKRLCSAMDRTSVHVSVSLRGNLLVRSRKSFRVSWVTPLCIPGGAGMCCRRRLISTLSRVSVYTRRLSFSQCRGSLDVHTTILSPSCHE